MNLLSTILTAVITSGVVSGVIIAILNSYIKSKEVGEQRRWDLKREACLEALEIIDARFADYEWLANGTPVKIDKQDFIPTAKIRSCFNRLVVACTDSSVPQAFETCLNLDLGSKGPQEFTMDTVVKLRNAIRKELGFGKELSTKVAWINNINWKRSKKQRVPIKPPTS